MKDLYYLLRSVIFMDKYYQYYQYCEYWWGTVANHLNRSSNFGCAVVWPRAHFLVGGMS
jgi:hypothetical protein